MLLAVLSVPLTPAHLEYDRFVETEKNVLEKTERLASLFRMPKAPTRESLIKDLVSWSNTAVPKHLWWISELAWTLMCSQWKTF